MNKTELIRALAERTDMTKAAAGAVVDALFDPNHGLIADELASPHGSGSVSLPGFGSFKTKVRSARVGHNPKTGAPVDVPARRMVTFKAGSVVTDLLNR